MKPITTSLAATKHLIALLEEELDCAQHVLAGLIEPPRAGKYYFNLHRPSNHAIYVLHCEGVTDDVLAEMCGLSVYNIRANYRREKRHLAEEKGTRDAYAKRTKEKTNDTRAKENKVCEISSASA